MTYSPPRFLVHYIQNSGERRTVAVTLVPARVQPAAPTLPLRPAEPLRHAAWNAFGR